MTSVVNPRRKVTEQVERQVEEDVAGTSVAAEQVKRRYGNVGC